MLNAREVQIARFSALYESLIDTDEWSERSGALASAAADAGLVFAGDGWDFRNGEGAPAATFGHLTVSDEVIRQGVVFASSWLQLEEPLLIVPYPASEPVFNGLDRHIFRRTPAWTWAWWCARLRDGDDGHSVMSRSLAQWRLWRRPDRRHLWTPQELLAEHDPWALRLRMPRLDVKRLDEVCAELGVLLDLARL